MVKLIVSCEVAESVIEVSDDAKRGTLEIAQTEVVSVLVLSADKVKPLIET